MKKPTKAVVKALKKDDWDCTPRSHGESNSSDCLICKKGDGHPVKIVAKKKKK